MAFGSRDIFGGRDRFNQEYINDFAPEPEVSRYTSSIEVIDMMAQTHGHNVIAEARDRVMNTLTNNLREMGYPAGTYSIPETRRMLTDMMYDGTELKTNIDTEKLEPSMLMDRPLRISRNIILTKGRSNG